MSESKQHGENQLAPELGPCSWHGVGPSWLLLATVHLPPEQPQCLLTGQGFPKETHSKYPPFPLGSEKENEILVHTVVPVTSGF